MRDIFSAVVVYILIWWIVLFCALPFGVKNITNSKTGMMPGAPVNPGLKKKLLVTSVISFVLWLIIIAIIHSDLISFHDMALKMRT